MDHLVGGQKFELTLFNSPAGEWKWLHEILIEIEHRKSTSGAWTKMQRCMEKKKSYYMQKCFWFEVDSSINNRFMESNIERLKKMRFSPSTQNLAISEASGLHARIHDQDNLSCRILWLFWKSTQVRLIRTQSGRNSRIFQNLGIL